MPCGDLNSVKAVSGRIYVQVEELTRNWEEYLGLTRGLAHLSASGKALNIDLFRKGAFTLSLSTLRAGSYGKEKSVMIVKVPGGASLPVPPDFNHPADHQGAGVEPARLAPHCTSLTDRTSIPLFPRERVTYLG